MSENPTTSAALRVNVRYGAVSFDCADPAERSGMPVNQVSPSSAHPFCITTSI